MKGASLFHVARKLHQRGAFTLPQAAGFAWKQFMLCCAAKTRMTSMPSAIPP